MGSYVLTGERWIAFSSGHRLARRAMEKKVQGSFPYTHIEQAVAGNLEGAEKALPGMLGYFTPVRKMDFAVEIENKPGEPLYFITREIEEDHKLSESLKRKFVEGKWEDEDDTAIL